MKKYFLFLVTLLSLCFHLDASPKLLSSQMIWNGSQYSAFTDLIYFQNQFLCCFRESNSHQNGINGTIRVLSSTDAVNWTSVASLSLDGYDLRDPKFSITPQGQLMMNMGATIWASNGSETLNSAVTFSADGSNWNAIQVLSCTGQWIWHITWNNGVAYGCSYSLDNTNLVLVSSTDGINYNTLKTFKTTKTPTEATLRFLPDNTMVALIRRNEGGGLIGSSCPPYSDWKWFNTKSLLGGPDFLILEDGKMWASSRQTQDSDTTCILAQMSLRSYKPVITFPSEGDCSYPGMVYKDGKLYVSYYSSQTGTACIYLSIVQL